VAAAGLAVVAASALGLAGLPGQEAAVAADGDSAVTVAWASGNSVDLQQYQPERDPESIHYPDFKDVKVTVSRTQGLTDEVVQVTVSGMPGATRRLQTHGSIVELGANFVQAMQCWGDPADPEFYKNCLYGAWARKPWTDSARPRVYTNVMGRGGPSTHDVPFRAVSGQEYSSLVYFDPELRTGVFELEEIVAPETTNERHEMVDSTGVASFLFEAQSAASQPYLGCGDQDSDTGTRCWLVVVPRGLHTTAASAGCAIDTDDDRSRGAMQQNSPVNPDCDYWANRVVVPLDFRPTGSACPPGSIERLVAGTEAIQDAFASWQTALCRTGDTAYSLTSAADAASRGHLIAGQVGMTITARPLTDEYLLDGYDREQLAEAEIVYAPVAVSGVVIAFLANNSGHREEQLRLSPRLLAKLVTHSYEHEQGLHYYAEAAREVFPTWSQMPSMLTEDPEFKALNPGTFASPQGVLIMTGPNPADGIAQFWQYLQADGAARAFLDGDPDNVLPGDEGNSGMTVNPYYLPKGHPNAKVPDLYEGDARCTTAPQKLCSTMFPVRDAAGAVQTREVGLTYDDGSPLRLSDAPVDTFPQADVTPLPEQLTETNQYRYDRSQARPYAASARTAARMVFQADTGSKTSWDNGKFTGLTPGAYASNGMFDQSSVLLAGFADGASAAAYNLATASLQVPNVRGVDVSADSAGMAAAIQAQTATSVEGVTITDPAALPQDAYPLTYVLYATVNLGASDQVAREQYADLIEFAVTEGQVPGRSSGQLPDGYLPLTDELRDQALAAVQAIRDYVPSDGKPDPSPSPTPPSTLTPSGDTPDDGWTPAVGEGASDVSGSGAGNTADTSGAETPNQPETGHTKTEVVEAAATASEPAPARAVLGGTFAAGLAGMAAGPLLLRRKRVLS
jgi:hypothetical protein